MRPKKTFLNGVAIVATLLTVASGAAAQPTAALKVIAIDVEGGAATLYITPEGKSLLVDAGWPNGFGGPPSAPPNPGLSSARHIAETVKQAGLNKIDYLLVTHFHADHVGGVPDLIPLIRIGAFIDHGPNREPAPQGLTPERAATASDKLFNRYIAAIAGKKRILAKPGEQLRIGSLKLFFVNADGQIAVKAVSHGAKGDCQQTDPAGFSGSDENARSIGFVANFGRAKILALGDTTAPIESKLVCPVGKFAPIDLLITSHHGSALSSSAALLAAARPTVAITDNGATKGGDAQTFDNLKATPGLQDIWQLHFATRGGPEKNPPVDFVANPAASDDRALALVATVGRDGAITITNTRNGFSKSYQPKH